MCIVIDDADPGRRLAQQIKTALRSCITVQRLHDILHGYSLDVAACKRCERIQDIMLARHSKFDLAKCFAAVIYMELRHSVIVEVDIRCIVVTAFTKPECNGIRQSADDALYERIGIVCDHGTVLRNQFRKLVKRSGNMFHILEIIKVVGIDIQNDLDFWLEIQEAVHVLACFRYKIVILPYINISVDFRQIAADQDRWLLVCIF